MNGVDVCMCFLFIYMTSLSQQLSASVIPLLVRERPQLNLPEPSHNTSCLFLHGYSWLQLDVKLN